MIDIALVGNPNSGKTTLFNNLTGSNQHIGNWPGVTVEKKEGFSKLGGKELRMIDLPGVYSLAPYSPEERITRDFILNEKPDLILNIIDSSNLERNLYLSTQLSELETKTLFVLNMTDLAMKEGMQVDDDILSAEFKQHFIKISASRGIGIDTLLDTIDKMLDLDEIIKPDLSYMRKDISDGVEYIKEQLGEIEHKDFTALKILEDDALITADNPLEPDVFKQVSDIRQDIMTKYGDDIESLVISDRYDHASSLVRKCLFKSETKSMSFTEKIDTVLLNKYAAIPIFLLTMFLVFQVTFGSATTYIVEVLETFISDFLSPFAGELILSLGASDFTAALITDGIIEGVGAVIVFAPQLFVLFLFISFLEDSGYMARAALLTDRILKKAGLTGKSFIPFIVGFGCSVPAIMAARTLDSEKDRRLTIFLAPFMSCGARAPVYAMIASAYFFRSRSLVIFSVYIAGILVAMLSGILLSRTVFKGEESPFVMELPKYQMPRVKSLLRHTVSRTKEFVKKAGTIILVASVAVWLLTNLDPSFRVVTDHEKSIIADIGRGISVIFKPLGFGSWIPSVAVLTGVFAKESVVSTISILAGADGVGVLMTPLAAYAFLIFILFYVPCVAAIGIMRRELNSLKWTLGAVLFQTATAWIMAFIIYNAGRLVGIE